MKKTCRWQVFSRAARRSYALSRCGIRKRRFCRRILTHKMFKGAGKPPKACSAPFRTFCIQNPGARAAGASMMRPLCFRRPPSRSKTPLGSWPLRGPGLLCTGKGPILMGVQGKDPQAPFGGCQGALTLQSRKSGPFPASFSYVTPARRRRGFPQGKPCQIPSSAPSKPAS